MTASAKPKIVYILPEYDPKTGSHFFYLYELLDRVRGDLDIMLIVERGVLAPRGFPSRVQRFSFAPLRFLELLAVLLWQRARGRRDFYVHYSYYGALAAWLVAALSGGRAFYWNCGMPWLYRRTALEENIFRFILRHAILVTGTPGLAGEYRRRYGVREWRVLPNWIYTARFRRAEAGEIRDRLGIAAEAKVVLFVHRLSRRKGAHLLAEIAAEVTKNRKDVIFVIVGDGPEKEYLVSKIRNQGIARYVRVVGEVPQKEIPRYFQAADLFLMPSEEEGFPHALLEAMASGVPFVASDVGGVREIIPPECGEFLVTNIESRNFAEKLLALLDLPSSGIALLREKERLQAERYDLPGAVQKFVNLF